MNDRYSPYDCGYESDEEEQERHLQYLRAHAEWEEEVAIAAILAELEGEDEEEDLEEDFDGFEEEGELA
ncbi:MAG: hypothetical protein ACRCX2_34760 [Paraclostridium sp.]